MRKSLSFTIEELVDIEYPSDAQFSPDGKFVAFVRGSNHKPDQATPSQKAIDIVELETGNLRQLTSNKTGTNYQPAWSPDRPILAFISNRSNANEAQLFTIDLRGGEAQSVTDLRGRLESPRWSPDGSWIAFLYNGSLEKAKISVPDPLVVDANPSFNRVWLVNVENHELKPVTPENCHVFEYAWSPDGKKMAVLTSPHPNPAEGWYSAQIHTIEIGSDHMQQICTMPDQIGRLTWSPDGVEIGFVSGVMSDEGNISGEVYTVPSAGGEARCITPGINLSITWIEWRGSGILAGGRQVDSAVLTMIDPQNGEHRFISKGTYAINGLGAQQVSTSQNGLFAAVRDSFYEPPNLYLGSLESGHWRQLSNLPVNTASFPPLHVENRFWLRPDGTQVHGFLVYPPDYVPGKRYPLFLHVHGGPSWGYVPGYTCTWERLMAALGCLVLMPNPRGSWGYGHTYQSANVGDLGGGDWQDINAGVDALIDEGLVDPERMAIGGWSYGGYLVAWAVTQTNRFRCAIAGAAITSYESNYGVVNNREWQTTMFGSNVYDNYELHRSRSPIAFVNRVKTPTLLVHGEQDTLAPVQQAIEFHTALKYFGVPTQLVIYPREPHGFQERAHQIDLLQRMVSWVDQYLFAE